MRAGSVPFLILLALVAGCSRNPDIFSERNARAHVEMLAGTIGSRPVGSAENARARAYVVEQLRLYGFEVRVQETDARRPELGRTARVANIIAVLPGERREAIGLVSHYDSRADTPGAADDAFGVAVSLEAARIIASRTPRRWTTIVLVTDAEEDGLLGAAAATTDAQVRDTLAAYLNVEATGSAGPVMLFETGPANGWLVAQWARSAPHPRGGSYAIEIYKRLPNDTDFSILRRQQIPGLNFALVGDSHSYHTTRDAPDRLDAVALREAGENVVGLVNALQQTDITLRTDAEVTYFDIGGVVALTYGRVAGIVISTLAAVLGLLAWLKVTRFLIREEGIGRWLLGFAWTLFGFAIAVAAMVAATAALREAREAYHPWYAHSDRFFLFLTVVGMTAGWVAARMGRWMPARAKGIRHPAVAWTAALPVWLLLAIAMSWYAPSAAYLWTLPLLSAGVVLLATPLRPDALARAASIVILAVSATLWLRETLELLRFMVAVFGRLPLVTPVYVYAALIALAGIMLAPPLFAVIAAPRPLVRPAVETALLFAAVAMTGLSAWQAPAYTSGQPLRGYVRTLQEPSAAASRWQVGTLEPGIEFGAGAPQGWAPTGADASSVPWARVPTPFAFSAPGEPLGPAPASVASFTVSPAGTSGSIVRVAILPRQASLWVSFVLPSGVTPARSNLPGVIRQGRWTATYIAPPPEGVAWEAAFAAATPEQLRAIRVAVSAAGVPSASGWQPFPAWLPHERTVWTAVSTWVLDPARPPLEPVPPLR